MTKFGHFWLILMGSPGALVKPDLADFKVKIGQILGNVVFGVFGAKKAQKQHIGNFQI